MIGTLLKAVAYAKAPRATFTVLHPKNAVLFRKFRWDMRHAHAPRVTALGAAALALPVGLWLGRRSAGVTAEVQEAGSVRPDADRVEFTGPRAVHRDGMEAAGPAGAHSTRGGFGDQTTAIGL